MVDIVKYECLRCLVLNQKHAYFYGLATILLWSTVASASKLTLRYLTPAEMVLYSSIVSAVFLSFVLVYQKKTKRLFAVKKDELFHSLGFALLNPVAYYLVLFKAYDLLPAQQAQVINYTWAITLSLLSIPILGQKLSRRQMLAITVSYFGVIIICTKGNVVSFEVESVLGVGLALLSTVFWALYWLANTRDKREPVVGLCINFIIAIPCILLYIWLFEGFQVPEVKGLLGGAYLGLFEMGLAFLLWLMAMKKAENAAKLANLIFLAPFLSLFFISMFLGEDIHPATFVGLVIIIVGLFIQGSEKSAKKEL